MTTPIVIIHGWSDTYKTFLPLKAKLAAILGRPVVDLFLGDWLSLEDELSLSDVAAAMQRAWLAANLPLTRRSVDVVVHSTGALVLREWIRRAGFKPDDNPVHHVGMLAPANHGSPLAHKGRSMIGRVAKGWNNWGETGTRILKALEMGSPYTWDLAQFDLLGGRDFWGANGMLGTVFVGDTGYSGLRSFINEDGSDGTVYVSTANLPCDQVSLDYTSPNAPKIAIADPRALVGFAIMRGQNHGSIYEDDKTIQLLAQSLSVSDVEFAGHVQSLQDNYGRTDQGAYQNTVFRVRDDHGDLVGDYLIEFTRDNDQGGESLAEFQDDVISAVHCYEDNKAYRSLVLDCGQFDKWQAKAANEVHLSLTASPMFRVDAQGRANRYVGYRTLSGNDIGDIRIPRGTLGTLVRPHRTLLVDILIRREQANEVFRILRE